MPNKTIGKYVIESNNISFDVSKESNKTFEGMFRIITYEAAGHSTSVNSDPVTIGDYVEKINNLNKPKAYRQNSIQPYISSESNKDNYLQNPSEKASIFKSKIAEDLFKNR